MADYESPIIKCDCHTHGISISAFDDQPATFYVQFWWGTLPNNWPWLRLQRLKGAWDVLRKGLWMIEDVVLDLDKARQLRTELDRAIVAMEEKA
jgi:hypothetical protein